MPVTETILLQEESEISATNREKNLARAGVLSLAALAAAGGAAFLLCPVWTIDQALHARLWLAGVRSRFATVGGCRVHYFVGGDGPALLLIHGLGSRAEDWTPQIPRYIQNGFRVYAVDLLGCGRTDRPTIEYTIQQQTEMIEGFLSAVGLEQADVIGWSMGGWVALNLALRHPQRIRRLVVMDSAGLRFPNQLTPEAFEPRTVAELEQLLGLLMQRPPRLPKFLSRAVLQTMQQNFPVVQQAVESMLTGRELLDGKLKEIRVPVLIVWGEEDRLIPLSVGMAMHREIPRSQMEIYPRCGHVGPATHAYAMVPRVVRFLRGGTSHAAEDNG